MHRFYCCSLNSSLRTVAIDDIDEIHHITRVLRLRLGDEAELINGSGVLARGILSNITKPLVEFDLLECIDIAPSKAPKIVLVCALPKRSKFDDILEQCTELGVSEVVPVITERTEFMPSREAMTRMDSRFRSVVISAAKQCKRLCFPQVHTVSHFTAAVDSYSQSGHLLLIPWLEGERRDLRSLLPESNSLQESANLGHQSGVVFFIGPEGDFSAKEASYAMQRGAIPVSLGSTVLRVETAAAAVVAYTHFIFTQ